MRSKQRHHRCYQNKRIINYGLVKTKQDKKAIRPRVHSRDRRQQHSSRNAIQKDKCFNDNYISCRGCRSQYQRNQCLFRETKCHGCDEKGHIVKVCQSKKAHQSTEQIAAM